MLQSRTKSYGDRAMRPKFAESDQMTIEEFLAFYDSRPDGERWELIEGMPIMSPSPTNWHQVIAGNILGWLQQHKVRTGASWLPVLGIGTRVPISPNSLPRPDVYVQERPLADIPSHITDDALVLFEVLSKSNTKADRAWRRRVYASVPNCRHYVTVSTTKAAATRHDRNDGWKGVDMKGLDDALDLPALGASIPLRDIYRWTPLA